MILSLTAGNIMDRDCLIIPQQLPVRDAARLLLEKRSQVAAVVDDNGHCTGLLRAADLFRWIETDCPNVAVDAGRSCPYQVPGRLLTGDHAVICTLAHGSCPFQVERPTTGGRYTDLCNRQDDADLPFGAAPRYVTTTFVSIRPQTPLTEMVRHIADNQVDALLVLDESDRPAGIVSATDIAIAVADQIPALATIGNEPIAPRTPQ